MGGRRKSPGALSPRISRPAPRRRAVVVIMMVAMVLIAAAAVSHVWTRLRAIEYGYKISKATRRNAKLVEVNRRLRIEVALLKNPARIGRMATDELGMQHPQPEQIRRLRLEGDRRPRPAEHLARAQ